MELRFSLTIKEMADNVTNTRLLHIHEEVPWINEGLIHVTLHK